VAERGRGRAAVALRAVLFSVLTLVLLRGRADELLRELVSPQGRPWWQLPGLEFLALLPPLVWLRLRWARSQWRPGPGIDRGVVALALAAGVAAAAVSTFVFQRIPHVQDEINYLWQARVFASGRLALPSHPLAEFFHFRFLVDDGRWYSLFQPGWPALLALGARLEQPWLVNPALAALLVALTWALGRETLGRAGAWRGALLLAASPAFWMQQGSMMAHGATAVWGVTGCWLWLRARRGAGPVLATWAASGAALGLLFVTRALDGVVLAVPLGLWTWAAALWPLRRWRPRAGLRLLLPLLGPLVFTAVGGALGGIQLAYNQAQTGSWRVFPQDRYFDLTESAASCHSLGFGPEVGCRREHGPDLAPGGFGPRRAVQVSATRLRALRGDLWGSSLGVALLALGLALGRRRRRLLAFAALAPMFGYFFYYYHGNCLGARYYYAGLPAMALLVGEGLRWIAVAGAGGSGAPEGGGRAAWRGALGPAVAFALGGVLVLQGLGVELPRRWVAARRGFWGVHDGLALRLQEQAVHHAVVIVPPSRYGPDLDDRDYRIGFAHARPDPDSSDVVIVRDQGPANPQLGAYYAGRSFYRFLPWSGPDGKGRLVPIPSPGGRPLRRLSFEAEGKFPAPRRRGGALRIAPAPLDPGSGAGQGHLLRFDPGREGDWFELEQWVFEAGDYTLRLRLARGEEQGRLSVEVDGQPLDPVFDGWANRPGLTWWRAATPLRLLPGGHRLRFVARGASPASQGAAIGLDRVELLAQEPAAAP